MLNETLPLCNCSALRQAARRVSRLYDAALAPLDLGINQFTILVRAQRLGTPTIQGLAKNLAMDRSTLGHLLRPLEARALLALRPSDTDRRSRVIAVTRDGADLIAKARPLWALAQHRFETAFGVSAALDLRAVLSRVEMIHEALDGTI